DRVGEETSEVVQTTIERDGKETVLNITNIYRTGTIYITNVITSQTTYSVVTTSSVEQTDVVATTTSLIEQDTTIVSTSVVQGTTNVTATVITNIYHATTLTETRQSTYYITETVYVTITESPDEEE
ncbi:MAG: uncharacterized protein A8A55_3118, partial [Amphiamblys sp. WSBS2006]